MSSLLTPTAQQAKDAADLAVKEATKQATDDYVNAILVSINSAALAGTYQYTANYTSLASTINVERLIHILGVDLKYKVSQDSTAQTLLIDWSNVPMAVPPTKDGATGFVLG